MANPVFFNIPSGAWTKVATNVIAGQIHRVSTTPRIYLQTYRLTGDPAPTLRSDGVKLFPDSTKTAEISSSVSIDVYVWSVGIAGRVRVDLP